MPDFFRKRFERDLTRLAAADGQVDIARLLASWSSDRSWAAAALRVPPVQRREILAELGRDADAWRAWWSRVRDRFFSGETEGASGAKDKPRFTAPG